MEIWLPWAAAILAIIVVVFMINSLIGKKNQVEFAFASIDAQLKKRCDLIPNLVSSCEKYIGYEETLLKELAATRSRYFQSGDSNKVAIDGQLSSQLRSVIALAENYPNLKASETFIILQQSLNEVEEQLAASRRAFNAAVTAYNNACQMFPTNIFARFLGYQTRTWFEIPAQEREPVKVWR